MALKRTLKPFYGKFESHMSRSAAQAARHGDHDSARRLYAFVEDRVQGRRKAHLSRGGRKPCRSGIRR